MLVCTVLNRMTLDLRAFSTTGGWFSSTRLGSDVTMGSGMPALRAKSDYSSNSNTLAELTLTRFTDDKWNDDNADYYTVTDSHVSTYGDHPNTFDAIEMGPTVFGVGRAQ